MTHDEHVEIALALRDAKPLGMAGHTEAMEQWVEDCTALAELFGRGAAHFDSFGFLTACGMRL